MTDYFFSQFSQMTSEGSGARIISGRLPLKISQLSLPKHLSNIFYLSCLNIERFSFPNLLRNSTFYSGLLNYMIVTLVDSDFRNLVSFKNFLRRSSKSSYTSIRSFFFFQYSSFYEIIYFLFCFRTRDFICFVNLLILSIIFLLNYMLQMICMDFIEVVEFFIAMSRMFSLIVLMAASFKGPSFDFLVFSYRSDTSTAFYAFNSVFLFAFQNFMRSSSLSMYSSISSSLYYP